MFWVVTDLSRFDDPLPNGLSDVIPVKQGPRKLKSTGDDSGLYQHDGIEPD